MLLEEHGSSWRRKGGWAGIKKFNYIYMYKILKDLKNIFTIIISSPHIEYLLKNIPHTLLNSPKEKDEKNQFNIFTSFNK